MWNSQVSLSAANKHRDRTSAICALCRLCTRDIAQSSFGEGGGGGGGQGIATVPSGRWGTGHAPAITVRGGGSGKHRECELVCGVGSGWAADSTGHGTSRRTVHEGGGGS